jgi:hypothetical protein
MPFSNQEHDEKCLDLVEDYFRDKKELRFLDVGPGAGKWQIKINQRFNNAKIEGCEIFPKYVEKYNLREKYHKIHISNILDFEWENEYYDVVIIGDVLEHLTIEDANRLLNKCKSKGALTIVQVPWMSPQGPYDGNDHEEHIQADLNPQVMTNRYPGLEYIICDKTTGAYYLPPKPRKADAVILTYVDDTPEMIQDFGWIVKSWEFSRCKDTFDIHVNANPSVIDKLKGKEGIQFIPREPMHTGKYPTWNNYAFINSIGCLLESKMTSWNGIEMVIPDVINKQKYTHFLKSDCDVFLTKYLQDYRPRLPSFGRGGSYAAEKEVSEKLQVIANTMFNKRVPILNYNVGSSYMMKMENLSFNKLVLDVSEVLMNSHFPDYGKWPGWYKGVCTMYGTCLAANARFPGHLYNMGDFDAASMSQDKIATSDYHIHAFHTHDYFSKHAYREGKYDSIKFEEIDYNTLSGYSHFIAFCADNDINIKMTD